MKKICLLLVTLLVFLTGCSSGGSGPSANITVEWKDGVIRMGGKDTALTEYSGMTGVIESGMQGLRYEFNLSSAPDVTTIPENTQSILEENMDKIKSKYYYVEYLGSQFTMANGVGEDYWEICRVMTQGVDKALIATSASNYLDDISLTVGQVYCDFGSFKLGNDYDTVTVRTDGALIPSIIKVSKGTYDCTEPVVIVQNNKEYQLMKGSSAKYEYYMYDGYLIQIAAGFDLNTYITFD